ncbi:MAG: nucleoside triphosphate pyrophosphohydrolase [Dokdonella sp.]
MKIDALLAIMAKLRDPEGGCPWDMKQDFASIAPYTIEEAYEVADAIDRRNFVDLRDELGDLLLQVVFHSQLASEAGHFTFDDVVASICTKMTNRHPHVFGDGSPDAADSKGWEAAKRREREARGDTDASTLAGISRGLPEWQRATKLQKRAATVGFEWTQAAPMLAKLREEVDEVAAEFAVDQPDRDRLTDEIGDVLFVATNLARHAKVDVSNALRHANAKFERRFRLMEQLAIDDGSTLADLSLPAQEALWTRAKRESERDV